MGVNGDCNVKVQTLSAMKENCTKSVFSSSLSSPMTDSLPFPTMFDRPFSFT